MHEFMQSAGRMSSSACCSCSGQVEGEKRCAHLVLNVLPLLLPPRFRGHHHAAAHVGGLAAQGVVVRPRGGGRGVLRQDGRSNLCE